MTERQIRELPVSGGTVRCLPALSVPLSRCRFCVHSTQFCVQGTWVASPARAFCMRQRATDEVALSDVTGVRCDDLRSEGYRSIMNIIS